MSVVACRATDLMGSITQRQITREGFLIAPGKIARAGNVQRYTADELGLDVTKGLDAKQVVRLFRPPTEVFSQETVKSFEGQTLTNGHPFGGVDAEKWREVSIGDVRHVAVDGDGLTAELIVRDAQAIKDVQSGKRELSCGYTFDCDLTPGVTNDGQAYDGTMTNIRGNHVAVVDAARGGPPCRIADEDKRRQTMATRPIIVDGISLDLEATSASIVEKVVGDAKKATEKANEERDKAVKRAEASDAALDQLKTASAQAADAAKKAAADAAKALDEAKAKIPTAAQIEALASERATVVADAATVVADIKCEGKSVPAIRTEVLTAVLAGDSAQLKGVATAVLGKSPDLSKVDEHVAKSAFDAVVAVKATAGDAEANDEVSAAAVLGDEAKTGKTPTNAKKLSGEDVLRARMRGEYREDKATA